jgi:hypothetical protein
MASAHPVLVQLHHSLEPSLAPLFGSAQGLEPLCNQHLIRVQSYIYSHPTSTTACHCFERILLWNRGIDQAVYVAFTESEKQWVRANRKISSNWAIQKMILRFTSPRILCNNLTENNILPLTCSYWNPNWKSRYQNGCRHDVQAGASPSIPSHSSISFSFTSRSQIQNSEKTLSHYTYLHS